MSVHVFVIVCSCVCMCVCKRGVYVCESVFGVCKFVDWVCWYNVSYRISSKNSASLIIRHPFTQMGKIVSNFGKGIPKY